MSEIDTKTQAAIDALGGKNDTLFLAIHDKLNRHPETIADCKTAFGMMSQHERVFYGLEDYSDNSKRTCVGCGSTYYGSGCDNCGAGISGRSAA